METDNRTNFFEWLSLNVDASSEEIASILQQKRQELDEESKKEQSSKMKLEDLTHEVAIVDLNFSIEGADVKCDENDITIAMNRLIRLSETLPSLKKRCAKVLDILVENNGSQGCFSSCERSNCFSSLCSYWSKDTDEQDKYIDKIMETLVKYETSGDGDAKNIYNNASNDDVNDFKDFVAFITHLQSANVKKEVKFKNLERVKKIQNDVVKLRDMKKHKNRLMCEKEMLEDITKKQGSKVRRSSETLVLAEEILMDNNLREHYKEYIQHPMYKYSPMVSKEKLKTMVDIEETYKKNLSDVMTKLDKLVSAQSDEMKKKPKNVGKKSDKKAESKYITLPAKVIQIIEEKRPFVVFSPLKSTFSNVITSVETANNLLLVCSCEKRLVDRNTRVALAVVLKELVTYCEDVYHGQRSLSHIEITEEVV